MKEQLDKICNALDEIGALVQNSFSDDRTLKEIHGWNQPPLTRNDLADFAISLSSRLKRIDPNSLNSINPTKLNDIPRKLKLLHADTIPYIFNGNGSQAVPVYITTINWISSLFPEEIDWQALQDNKAMPHQMIKRLRGIQAEIEALVPDKEKLEKQVQLIQEATETAESLPADLQTLKDAHKTIDKLSTSSAELYGKIDAKEKEAASYTAKIAQQKIDAEKIVQQCEEAYRITTTKGLAAAFDQRASRLNLSMWVWVIGLLIALGIGAHIGTQRVELLSEAVAGDPHWGVIWMHIVLSLLSLAAPLWFAWLATKQIGQRFRLAEDYGFKASVAKAYEGYRKEAARIDEAFEARLFLSALTRLEEAPLRLVEESSHGSPWHELITSNSFQKALKLVPELKDDFIAISKKGANKILNSKEDKDKTD